MTVFFSEAVGAERLPFGAAPPSSTARTRRWRRLASLYREGLNACGVAVAPLLRPEIYQTEVARQACGAARGDWHMAVKPLEHLRPFHGLPNVFVCDWEYTALSAKGGPGAPFLNHRRVLQRAEVVACCTEATLRTMRQAGLQHAVYLPPFVADAPPPGEVMRQSGGEADCTCLALMDAGDPAHAWASLLRGFAAARGRDGRLRLMVAVDGTPVVDALRDEMLARFELDHIGSVSFVGAPHGTAVACMAAQADVLLDVSSVGGFPISAVQAMQSGLPVVAVSGAALGLPDGAQIRIDTTPADVTVDEEPAVDVMPLRSERPTESSVCAALLAAAALTPPERLAMADAARRFAQRRYGRAAFGAALRQMHEQYPGLAS